MHKISLPLLALPFLLASCTLPQPSRNPPQDVASSSSASSVSTVTYEETGEGAPTTEERAETGALPERLLSTGVVEVGAASAPLTLLLFTEHHCSYCRQFQTELFPRLKADFLSQGTLNLQIAMLPLQKYPQSREAALGFICSAAQGAGISMHEALFFNPNKGTDAILSYATDLKINTKTLRDCLKSDATATILANQEAWARSLNVTVVPTFFLNGEKSVGLPTFSDLKGKIQEALEKIRSQGS